MKPVYKRIVLKLSGEVLDEKFSGDASKSMSDFLVEEISQVRDAGVEVSIVVGGGNILRGVQRNKAGVNDRVTADQMGMLATVINALMLKDAFESANVTAVVMSAIDVGNIAEKYNKTDAVKHLSNGEIVIFGGGTSNPYFSTDTAAALRALEINADALVKGSKVDGVYDKDPMKYDDAKKLEELTYNEALENNLRVMDQTAFAILKESEIPIVVYHMTTPGMLMKVLSGESGGSVVRNI
ncbi:MAG: UMP kinase [bacterium]